MRLISALSLNCYLLFSCCLSLTISAKGLDSHNHSTTFLEGSGQKIYADPVSKWLINSELYTTQGLILDSTGSKTFFWPYSTFISECAIPDPTGMGTTDVKANQATIYWEKPSSNSVYRPNGTYYKVRWRIVGDTTWLESIATKQNTYILTGLTPNSQYEWQVRRFCSPIDFSLYSQSQFINTVCPTSTSPLTSLIQNTSAKLTWNNVTNAQFEVCWRAVGNANWSIISSLTTNSVSLTGLTKSTSYEWQVRSLCSDSLTSEYSSISNFTTLATCRAPDVFLFFSKSPDGITVQWSGPSNQPGTAYLMRWRILGTTTWTESTTFSSPSYKFQGLSNSTPYQMQVRLNCDSSTSADSFIYSFITGCEKPDNRIFNVRATSVNFRVYTLSTSTDIELQHRPQGALNWKTTYYKPANDFPLTALLPNTTYEYRTRIICSETSMSDYSAITLFTTLSACEPTSSSNTLVTATPISGTSYSSQGVCLNNTTDRNWYKWVYNEQTYYILVRPFDDNGLGSYRLSLNVNNGLLTVSTSPYTEANADTFLQVYAWDGTTLLAENDDYEWPFSQVFLYLSEGCSTVRNGLWNDPTTWSCFRVPTLADKVQVLHTVTIPQGTVGTADRVIYGQGGLVKFEQGAGLQIEP